MLNIGNADNFRRTVAGMCLIAAPLVSLVSYSLELGGVNSSDGFAESVAQSPNVWRAAALLGMLSAFLYVPAVMGLLHLLRARAVVLGHLACGILLIGAFGEFSLAAFDYQDIALFASDANRGQVGAISDQATDNFVYMVVLVGYLLGLIIGHFLLAGALWRAKIATPWAPALIALGQLVLLGGGIGGIFQVVGWALLTVGLGWIGLKVLRMSDAQWGQASSVGTLGAVDAPANRSVSVR
jgi:hypothetical protein